MTDGDPVSAREVGLATQRLTCHNEHYGRRGQIRPATLFRHGDESPAAPEVAGSVPGLCFPSFLLLRRIPASRL